MRRSIAPWTVPLLTSLLMPMGAALPVDAQARAPANRQARTADSPPCSSGPDCALHIVYYVDGPTTTTGVAGSATGSGFTLSRTVATTDYWAIYESGPHLNEIEVGERGDEPCYLRIVAGEVGDVESWNGCGAEGPASRRSVRWGAQHVLVGLRICTNNRNDERGLLVKGVEVRVARRPHLSGSARMMDPERFARPNCRQWHPWVMCPGGTAATTLRGRHVAIGGRRGLVGVQLECAPVEGACFRVSGSWGDDSPACRQE